MNNFAFVVHPIDPQKDVARKFPWLGKLPRAVIDRYSRYFPPQYLSTICGIRSHATGESIKGWLLACPLTPARMLSVPTAVAYHKIIQTGRLAERLGAKIVGLGAFTSVVGDAGQEVARHLSIPVTTGNSYTIAVAVESLLQAAGRMELQPHNCTVAVVGAYGSIGRACALLLARSVRRMILIGRQRDLVADVAREVAATGARTNVTTSLKALGDADMVLTVTSALAPVIEPEHLKPGSVVCDVARPRDVSRKVAEVRSDVLVIEGGMVDVPGTVDFGFDFGFPPGKAYACMAETMILALEGRYECFTIGRGISLDRVDEIAHLADKHGFRASGFRSFERAVTESEIERVKQSAFQKARWIIPAPLSRDTLEHPA